MFHAEHQEALRKASSNELTTTLTQFMQLYAPPRVAPERTHIVVAPNLKGKMVGAHNANLAAFIALLREYQMTRKQGNAHCSAIITDELLDAICDAHFMPWGDAKPTRAALIAMEEDDFMRAVIYFLVKDASSILTYVTEQPVRLPTLSTMIDHLAWFKQHWRWIIAAATRQHVGVSEAALVNFMIDYWDNPVLKKYLRRLSQDRNAHPLELTHRRRRWAPELIF